MSRAFSGLLAAFLVVAAAANIAFRIGSDSDNEPGNAAWKQDRMEFVAWNDEPWTAWIHEGSFELVPEDSANWSRHSNAGIAFIDWEGERWQAKTDSDVFLLAHEGNWDGNVLQDESIRYRDWDGNNQLRSVADLER